MNIFNDDYLVRSEDYAKIMDSDVVPWLKAREHVLSVPGLYGNPLYCVSYDAEEPRGTVVIVHGFTENAFKFSELIFSLLHEHFSVVAYDQRGHGRSWRDRGIPDPSMTHVGRFSDYVSDLKIICAQVLSAMPKPWMVFGHSMGGAVTVSFLEQDQDFFSGAVLCAPMIAPNLKGLPSAAAAGICRAEILARQAKRSPFFMKPYAGHEDFDTSCATDPRRFAWYDNVKFAHREFQNSVPTSRWILESIHVTKQLLADGAPEKISCPVLLFTADQDSSVLPGPQKQFIDRVSRHQHVFVPGSRHEIYRSENAVLFPWWHRILAFLRDPVSAVKAGDGQ